MGMLSAFSPQLLEQAKRSGVLGLPIEQPAPNPSANYKRFKGPGLLGALFAGANAAIDSDIYDKGLAQRQNQFLGTVGDYDNAIQEAARLGRTDWVDRLKQQQAEASQAALRQQYGGILGGSMPAQQPQPSAIPAPQMPQAAPTQQGDQAPVISKATGLPIQPDVNVVQGTMRRPAPPAPDPSAMAARYEQAAQLAYQGGDLDQAKQFTDAATTLRKQAQDLREANRQRGAVMLGSALRLSGDAQIQQFNYVLNELADSMGVRFPPEVNDALLDPSVSTEQKAAIVQAMIAYSAPEDAAKELIGVEGNRQKQMDEQQYAPVQALDIGPEKLLYGGTGNIARRFRVGVSPNTSAQVGATIRGQDITRTLGQGRLDLERRAVEATEEWMGGGAVSQMSNEELLAIVAAARGGK